MIRPYISIRIDTKRDALKTQGNAKERFGPATTTSVFDAYWMFAAERQSIYFRRLRNQPPPWTSDTTLRSYRFTNPYRASDRVSQFLIRNVIYDRPRSDEDTLFRILVFKLFNKIETWNLLCQSFGDVRLQTFSFREFDKVLTDSLEKGMPIYSAAYMMPSPNREFGTNRKHQGHLRLIEKMLADKLPEELRQMDSMGRAFDLLLSYPTIGKFLAYQLVTDINYSTITNFSEDDFVMPGPGARDGISKCFSDLGGLSESEVIRLTADRQVEEFKARGLCFETLGHRLLQLIDVQNLYCEISKYSRVSHPQIKGISGRRKIKQTFRPIGCEITAWFPPKWEINEIVAKQIAIAKD